MKRKLAGLIGLAVLAATMTVPAGAEPRPPKGIGRWSDPVLVSTDQAHRETSLAINPKDPSMMFVCAPSGVPNTQHNQSYFHMTNDGGRTWNPLRVEGGADDPRNYAFEGGDCDVAFDAAGTMYSADTWLGNLSVGHSRDGGKTWQGTSLATTSPIVDRPWLVATKEGTVHLTHQALQCCTPSAIWYARSDDYGMSFSPSVPVASAGPNGAFTWQGNFVVSKDEQDLYLVYTRRAGATDRQGPETVWVAASHDAGQTWESHLLAERDTSASFLYPSIAMDKAGLLHVVFSSPTDKDVPVWYSISKDEAKSWSEPIALDRGEAGYSPWVAASGKGDAVVAWYGSTDPEAPTPPKSDWYFYWARIKDAHAGSPKVTTGRTTKDPIFTGKAVVPEFEMVKLDEKGRMHIGMSAYRSLVEGGPGSWAIYYQREKR